MTQQVFSLLVQDTEAAIRQVEAEIEELDAQKKDKKAQLKMLRQSLAKLNGTGRAKGKPAAAAA